MQLSVVERLMIQSLLPNESDYTNLKLVRVARETLSFDEMENAALNFKQDGDKVTWTDSIGEKDVDLGEVVTVMIVNALKKLSDDKQLKNEQMSLYEKFVEGEGGLRVCH